MSELILCKGRIASLPYYIESAELNIYSLEELCYFISHNLYALSRDLMSEELIAWMERELGEEELAEKLRASRRAGVGSPRENDALYQFFMTILLGSGYLNKKELASCDEVLKGLRDKSPFQCRKIRADHYLNRELYARAITEYRLLLESEERKGETEAEIGNVLHNLGCAYAGLFLFQEAEECFRHAAAKNQSIESSRLLTLCRSIRENGADLSLTGDSTKYEETVRRALSQLSVKDTEGFYETLGTLIRDYQKEYRRNSQVI